MRLVRLEAPRGDILDREGRVLATTRPAFGVTVMPSDLRRPERTLPALGMLLDADAEELRERVGKPSGRRRFQPVRLAGDLSYDHRARVESHLYALPGISTDVRPRRHYVEGVLAAHLLGTIGEIQREQLQTREFRRLPIGRGDRPVWRGEAAGAPPPGPRRGAQRGGGRGRARGRGARGARARARRKRHPDHRSRPAASRRGGLSPRRAGGAGQDGWARGPRPAQWRRAGAGLEALLRPERLRRRHRRRDVEAPHERRVATAPEPRALRPVSAGLGVQAHRGGGGARGRGRDARADVLLPGALPARAAYLSLLEARGPRQREPARRAQAVV